MNQQESSLNEKVREIINNYIHIGQGEKIDLFEDEQAANAIERLFFEEKLKMLNKLYDYFEDEKCSEFVLNTMYSKISIVEDILMKLEN